MSALLKQRLLGQPGGCHTTPPTGARPPIRGDNTPFTSTKGLLNGPGQNNCFLNSAVQVLWHLDVFRRSFRELSGHACMAEACIFCALKELFGQLQFSQESALPPDALRRALAESFFDQQRFQLGFMDDAAECFENILLRIHYHIANGEAEDMCAARHCIPHQKFAMTLVEQSVCEACHVTSEPLSYTQMVHYVSASALTAQARNTAKTSQPDLFGQLLRKAGGMGDIRDCPSSCGAKIQICRALMNRPEVVSVGVVWDSERPTLEHIMSVFATVGTTLRLSDVFHSVVDHRWAAATTHSLVGVVTYYGKHYSTFFFHTKLRLWIYFDDANVREIGPRFEQVVEKCRRGRYQPLLLLYAVQGGTPVSTEGAPKTVVPISVTPRRGKLTSQIPLRRSVTPSPEKVAGVPSQRRAVTPNPDRYADYQNLADIQANIFSAEEPGYISRQAVESVMSAQNALSRNNSLYEPKRNGPSADGIAVPDHLNVPRRRDSGNWSGDRNSASSSSSLENPYLCLVGRMRPVPRSPKPSVGDCGGVMDPGYDSYSLSSNDSLPLQQQLKHNLQLAQIPEHSAGADDCERLCVESDRLLGKARQLEAACDLETALVVSRAAGDKARRAMDAPYNNPRALSLARMKHNACVMHARSLARRMDETALDIRHSRENSGSSNRSASHSRQSSRDKTQGKPQHSRQSSRELVQPPVVEERKPPPKSIEIYATLPRKKLGSPRAKPIETEEDAEYMYERPGRSLQSRVGLRKDEKKDKRAKSEERKSPRDYSLLNTSSTLPKESPKKDKEKEKERAKEEKRLKEEAKKNEAKAGKKQHKIRRKLLMGGLIRRKNRSMPDLREGQDAVETKPVEIIAPVKLSQDDAALPDKSDKTMSGYLSEGHLEYGRSNPNLERSRLMRKTSHGAKGRLPPKVPPLPPLRTSSQLTAMDEPRVTYEPVTYANGGILGLLDPRFAGFEARTESTQSLALPPYPSPLGSVNHSRQPSEEFPPPPPPLEEELAVKETSTLLAQLQIKRQQILEKDGSPRLEPAPTPPPPTQSTGETWLRELQAKQAERRRRQPPAAPAAPTPAPDADCASVRDLASRFESAKTEKTETYSRGVADAFYPTPSESTNHAKNIIDNEKYYQPPVENLQVRSHLETTGYHKDIDVNGYPRSSATESSSYSQANNDSVNYVQKMDNGYPPIPELQQCPTGSPEVTGYARESPKSADLGVEYLSLSRDTPERVNHHPSPMTNHTSQLRDVTDGPRRSKKKNVTFCDEVILVATADDDEDDPFIPNPILERVLRSAFRPAQAEVRVVPGAGSGGQTQHQVTAQMHPVPASVQQVGPTQPAVQSQQMPLQNQPALQNHQVPVANHQSGLPNHQTLAQNHQSALQNQQPGLPNIQTLQNHQMGLPNHQPMQNHQPPQNHHLTQSHQATQNHQPMQNHQPGLPNHQPALQNHQQVSHVQPNLSQPQYNGPQMQQVPYQQQQQQQAAQTSANQYRDFQQHPTSAGQAQSTYPQVYQQIPSNSAKYQQFLANSQSQDGHQVSSVGNQQVPTHVQSPSAVQPYQHVPANSQQYQQNQIPRYQHLPNQQRMGQRLHQQSPTYGQQQYQHAQPSNYPSQNGSSGIPQYQQSPSQIPTAQSYQHPATNGTQQVPGGQPQYYQQLPASKLQQPAYQRVPMSAPNGGSMPNGGHPPYQHPPPPRQQAGTRQGYQASESSIARPVYQAVPENAAVRAQSSTESQPRPAYQPAGENSVARPVYQQDSVQSRVMYQANQDSGHGRVAYQDGTQRLYQQSSEGVQNRSAGQPAQDGTQQPRPSYPNHDNSQPRPVYGQVPETGQPAAKAGPCHLCRKKPVATPAIYCTDCHFYMSRFKPRA